VKKAASWFIPMVFLVLLTASSPGEAGAAPSITEAYLASGVAADGSPSGRVSAYDPSAKEFVAVAEVRDAQAGTAVRFLWFSSPPGRGRVRLGERTVTSPISESSVTFHSSLTLGKNWPEGKYVVDIHLLPASRPSASLRFDVKKGAVPPAGKIPDAKKPIPGGRETDEKTVAEKESSFRENPGSFRAALELAEAYAAMDDAASLALAVSLFRGLAAASPSDTVLAGLADAWGRSGRFGQAFDTALRRAWNPMVSPAGAVSQILLFSAATRTGESNACAPSWSSGKTEERTFFPLWPPFSWKEHRLQEMPSSGGSMKKQPKTCSKRSGHPSLHPCPPSLNPSAWRRSWKGDEPRGCLP